MLAAFLSLFSLALPLLAIPAASKPTSHNTAPFYLVSTTQSTPPPSGNSSLLASVSALSIFDPYYQDRILIRIISPGYGSLQTFTVANHTLVFNSTGAHGIGPILKYEATYQKVNETFEFLPQEAKHGDFGLKGGHLITAGGKKEGWTLCNGDLEETVVVWMGTDSSCVVTFLQAVAYPPY